MSANLCEILVSRGVARLLDPPCAPRHFSVQVQEVAQLGLVRQRDGETLFAIDPPQPDDDAVPRDVDGTERL